jgi:hypothetical protein
MIDFDLTAYARAQQQLENLGFEKTAFTPLPGGGAPQDPSGGGGMPGMPPGGAPPSMPPGMPPEAAAAGGGGGAPPMDPTSMMAAMQQMGMSPPQEQTQPVSMTIDQLIKLVAAITGKGGTGSKKHERRMMQLEMLLQHNGIHVPPDAADDAKDENGAQGSQQSAIQPVDGNTAGGLMGAINPMAPMKE